jgi:lipopolysaccharide transport system permease protein
LETATISAASENPDTPVLVIRPAGGGSALDLSDLWRYRELIGFLTWRDISVRYKQTALGAAWAILQPFFTMVVFSVFFGRLGRIPSDGIPYPLFTFCALLPWQLFAYALSESSNSLVANQSLVTKVYFPRLVIPLASTLSGLVDFAIALVVFAGMLVFYRVTPTPAIAFLPAFVALALLAAISVGLWLSALNVQYRDVRYTLPFLTQFWLFATPIAYPSSMIPERWRALYGLNPMAGVVEGFRWALLGLPRPSFALMSVSAVVVLLLLAGGLSYFRAMERTFADTL